MNNIEKLIQLNAELEGLLHILAKRDNESIRNAVEKKYAEYLLEFDALRNYLHSNPLTAVEEVTETLDSKLTDIEVKDQEAVENEVEDEMDASVEALEHEEFNNFAEPHITENEPIAEVEDELEIIPIDLDEPIVLDDSILAPDTEYDVQPETEVAPTEVVTEQEPKPVEADNIADNDDDEEDAILEIHDIEDEVVENQNNKKFEGQFMSSTLNAVDEPAEEEELSVDEMLHRREAADLKRVFTLNDKFRFRRALFNQDDSAFAFALQLLAEQPTFADAKKLLTTQYGWELTNPDVEDFLSIIKPHYAK